MFGIWFHIPHTPQSIRGLGFHCQLQFVISPRYELRDRSGAAADPTGSGVRLGRCCYSCCLGLFNQRIRPNSVDESSVRSFGSAHD